MTTTPALQRRQRAGVFYGWWVVLAAMGMAFYYSGVFFYAFTLLLTPIREELGWSGTLVSQAFFASGIVGAILAPPLGAAFDRFGPKLVVAGGMLAGGLGFFVMSRMTEPWQLYVGLSLAAVGPVAIWAGAIPAVANWFIRQRGRALGITTTGLGLGGILASVALVLIESLGWRDAVLVMALGIWLLLTPLAFVLRRRPEDYGLLPDGDPAPDAATENPGAQVPQTVEDGLTLRQTLRSPVFWLLALVLSLAFWPIGGLQIHMAPYLEEEGFTRAMAATAVSAMAVTTVIGRLGGGWLADIFDARKVMTVALGLQAVGMVVFAFVSPGLAWLLVPFLLAFAPGFGGLTVLQPALQGLYFGRRAFGAIQGVLWTITSLSFSFAPLILAWLAELLESFRPGLGLFGVLSLIGAVIVLALPRPRLLSR